jgi:SAM-dependent methyltransferase
LGPGEAPPPGAESDRLEAVYGRYAASRRRRRGWSASNPGNVAIRRELLEAVVELGTVPLSGQGSVLDVGCGSGWLLAELAAGGVEPARLHGVDLLEGRVEAAARRLPGATIERADARALPFPDRRFELVLLFTALSSMASEEAVARALAEAARVVSASGLVLCYEPWVANPFNRSTRLVATSALTASLGPPLASRRLTGLPPLARRLGRATPRLYPLLTSVASTHRLTAHSPASAPRGRG